MKKKFLVALLAVVCALCCAFGMAACKDKEEDGAAESEPKMTQEQWSACLTSFATGKNFSLQMTVNNNVVGAMKLQGSTYYDIVGSSERIYTTDGTNYNIYRKNSSNPSWTKSVATASEYNSAVNTDACDLVNGATAVVIGNYDKFTYADNKYTANSVIVIAEDQFEIKDVEITVKSGKVTKIVCVWIGMGGDVDKTVTIDSVGSTTIPVPNV